jgi:dTDP-glucose 4,6-dehydratase
MNEKDIVMTGGAGFIGSHLTRALVARGYRPHVIDSLTYSADKLRLADIKDGYRFYKFSINEARKVSRLIAAVKPAVLINVAAETHVDRSIVDSDPFMETNIKGVNTLCRCALQGGVKQFIHISTDEVYGDTASGSFTESSPLHPNSPYAASKAAADLIVQSYIRTYGLPAIIVRPSNNYGPWQYPEKLIPLSALMAMNDRPVSVYGTGENIREWLHVFDTADALVSVLERGEPGEIYNIGSGMERKNIDVVKMLLRQLGKPESLIRFVADRPGHDIRYSVDCTKIKTRLGWQPTISFEKGLEQTAAWMSRSRAWLDKKHSASLSFDFRGFSVAGKKRNAS